MTRLLREAADERILDLAAALFALHGFERTSLQALADAVGLSKAGLLHHFPTKEALHAAALQCGRRQAQVVLDQVTDLPAGPRRDRRVLELLTDFALARPGIVSLLLRPITAPGEPGLNDEDLRIGELFAEDRPDRHVRLIGALSAMGVLTLVAGRVGATRDQIIDTCFDALGHRSET
ncbi:TetR/AcrR family transcriptional regulator [Pseudonocardiaceae bacterium YIM PH 21723]|nr:TetR/AcrR family transcriptional regulator [Pseudonocardiaceae bacterium YIM PH 21723]